MHSALITTSNSSLQHSNTFSVANLTPDELYYLKLEKEYTIKQYEDLKIKDEGGSGLEGEKLARLHIGNCLLKMYELVGLKKENHPSDDLAKQISRYIQKTFPYIAPIEILKAIEMALQGKFPATRKDGSSILEHFQVMDLTYINEILQGYVKFRYDKKENALKKINEVESRPARDQIIKMLIDDDKAVKDLIIQAFNRYVADPNDRVTWLRDAWFDWLVDLEIVQYDKELLNSRFKVVRDRRPELSSKECQHLVKVHSIYDAFENIKEKENPFEIFNNVSYVSPYLINILINTKKD
jgi:hypothetical protein